MKTYRAKFKTYLNDLGKRKPSPGGGSAVSLAFCLGVSLIEKAINYSDPKKFKKQIIILKNLRNKAYIYVDKDAYLFEKIMNSKGARRLANICISEKMIVDLAKNCQQVFSLAKAMESGIKKGIISDFHIGLKFVKITLFGCISNLEANSKMFGKKNKHLGELKKALRKCQ
ncbi:MAG: cyclodeaminase/cyclohydrolase family protein [Candidatus Omnitrophica bacterium]|nr:cyclodeaminase/cyclohydrolase family protein [Candidatus Omnitrophota bacterium]